MTTWADYWNDNQTDNPAAPEGLGATASRFAREQNTWAAAGQGLQPWLPDESYMETARSWYGGQNPNSTRNGWDTDFADKAFAMQYDYLNRAFAQDDKGVQHPSLYYQWLDDPNAYGVATWNDPRGRFRAGDVFVDGKKQEGQNLYEVFDQYTADVMLADFIFSDDERSRFNEDRDVQGRYRREVQGRIESDSAQAVNAPGAERFQTAMKTTQQEYQEGWQEPAIIGSAGAATGLTAYAAIAAGGFLTGAGATAWSGPGAILGGIAAGASAALAAWLNSDSLTETAAYAEEVVHQSTARASHNLLQDVGYAAGVYGGTLGRKVINPFSNAVQGGFEILSGDKPGAGEVGDGESQFYKLDENGERIASGKWQATDFAAQGADAVLLWSSPVGKFLDFATMSSYVAGSATNIFSQEGFNDRIGGYDEYEGTAEWSAAIGAFAIDAVQLTTMGAIARRTKSVKSLESSQLHGTSEVLEGGTRFTLNDLGRATDHRMTLERWAPSEAARWMTVQARARLRAARTGTEVDSDALYQAAKAMTTDGAWARAVVNGYAEGAEEFVQGILEPISYSERIDPDQLLASTISGVVGGAGMSLGTLSKPADPEKVRKNAVKLNFMRAQGLETLDDATFDEHYKGMTEVEKEILSRFTPESAKENGAAWEVMTEVQRANVASTSILGNIGQEAVREAALKRTYEGANPATDSRVKILGQNGDFMVFNGQVEKIGGGNTAVLSATQFIRMMAKKLDAFIEMSKAQLDPAIEAELSIQIQVSSALFRHFAQRYEELMSLRNPNDKKAKISEINKELARLYNGQDQITGQPIAADRLWASQKAAEIVLKRDPVIGRGSVGIYLPQVSWAMSEFGGDGAVSVNHPLLKSPGADHDGDDFADLNMQWWGKEDWEAMRLGAQYVIETPSEDQISIEVPDPDDPTGTSTITKQIPGKSVIKVEVDAPDDDKHRNRDIAEMLDVPGSAHEGFVHAGWNYWYANVFQPHYVANGPLSDDQLETAWAQYQQDVRDQHPDARVRFAERLFTYDLQGLLLLGRDTKVPEVAWLWDQMSQMQGSILENAARYNAVQFMQRYKNDPATTVDISSDWRMPEELKFQETIAVRDAINSGTTLGILLGNLVERASQKIYYTFYRSAVEAYDPQAGQWVPDRVVDLARQYTFLSSGDIESSIGKLENPNRIEERVVQQLVDMAKLGGVANPDTVFQIAMTRAPAFEFDPDTGVAYLPPDAGSITMLQLLLRKSVQMEEARIAQLPQDDPVRAKITKFKGLSQAGQKSSYTAKTAWIEVFRDHQLYEVLGDKASYIGPNLTVGQAEAMLWGRDSDTRSAMLAALRMSPAYFSHHKQGDPPYDPHQFVSPDGTTRPAMNAFTMFVDALTASINTRVAEIERKDNEDIEALETMLGNVRKRLDTHQTIHRERLGAAVTRVQVLNDWLEQNPREARGFIDALPPDALPAIFQGNRAKPAIWLEQVLRGEDYDGTPASDARVAVNFRVMSWMAQFNEAGGRIIRPRNVTQNETPEEKERLDREHREKYGVVGAVRYGQLDSRMLQLMHRLAAKRAPEHGVGPSVKHEGIRGLLQRKKPEEPRAARITPGRGALLDLDLLVDLMYKAESLKELKSNINAVEQWHVGRERQFIMRDDKSDFEVDPNSVWATNLPSSLQRDKINELSELLTLTNEVQVEEAAGMAADEETIRDLRLYHQEVVAHRNAPATAKKPVNIGNTARLYALVNQMITNRARMTDGRGPNVRNIVSDAAMDGLITAHDKGSSDPDFEVYGNALITMRNMGVMTDVDLELAAWTAQEWAAVQSNLTRLAEGPFRIQWDDGSTTRVDLSDVGQVLDALADPRLRSLVYAVMLQTSRDLTGNGTAMNYHDVTSMSLTSILEEQTFGHVFAQNRPVLERAHRWMAYAEARAIKMAEKGSVEEKDRANDVIQNLVNDFLVRYLQKAGVQYESREGIRDELYKDLYDAVTLIAGLKTDEERERLRIALKLSLANRHRDQSKQLADFAQDEVTESLKNTSVVSALIKYITGQEQKLIKQMFKAAQKQLAATPQSQEWLDAQDEVNQVQGQLIAVAEALNQLGEGEVINLPRFDDLDVDSIYNQYRLTGDPQGDMHRKASILKVLLEGNTVEQFHSHKDVASLITKVRKAGSKRRMAQLFTPSKETGKGITDKEWAILTGWVVAAKISQGASRGSSQVQLQEAIMSDEGLQTRKYYDVTGASLVDDLFDSLLVGPTIEMMENAALPEHLDRPRVTKVKDRILSTLFDERKIGDWTDRVPVEGMKLRSILRNSSVALAIPRGGNTPRKIMDLIASGHVTVEAKPIPSTGPGGHHSLVTLTNIDHGETLENHLDWLDIMKLDNHFVHRVRVTPGPKTQASAQGVPTIKSELDFMLTNATKKNYSHTDVENSGYEVLSLATLQAELDAQLPDEGYLDYNLEIEYVDVDKKPYTAEYVNSIYFDGVGRESFLGRGGGPIAQLWLAQGGLSKIAQQQPLNWLTKAGKRFRHLTATGLLEVESLEQSGLDMATLMHAKALRMLTKDDYDTGYLQREDIPALYKMVKMRHLVVGWERQPDGSKVKRLYWADEWIQFEANDTVPKLENLELVQLNEPTLQTLLGRMGEKGKKGVWGDPSLVMTDGVAMPNLDLQRLKDLGLERLGETTPLSNSYLAQVQPRSKVIYRSDENIRRAQRDFEVKMRNWETVAAPIRTARKRELKSSFNAKKQANTHKAMLLDILMPEKLAKTIAKLGVPVDRLVDPKAYSATKHMIARIDKIHQNYPQATISVYDRAGSSNPSEGVYAAAEMDADFNNLPDYQKPIVKDVWIVNLDSYLELAGDDELAYNMAKTDLSVLMKRGVYVVPVTKKGHIDFRADIITWINTGERGYRAMPDDSYMFGPADPSSDVGVNTAALESTLSNTAVYDGRSPHWAIRVLGHWWPTNENTVNTLPRGTRYRKVARQLIPTQYSKTRRDQRSAWAYNVPTDGIIPGSGGITEKQQTRRLLLEILDKPDGLKWLANEMAKGDPKSRGNLDLYTEHPNGDITEGILPIEKSLEILRDELKAGLDVPRPGKVLRTGSAYPLLSADGTTVMVARLGFQAPTADEHDAMADTYFRDRPGNVVIFGNKLEDAHTTTPPMTVTHIHPDQRGYSVLGTYDLSDIGKRTDQGLGFKKGAVPWPEKFRPPNVSLSKYNDTHITESTTAQAPEGKNAIGGDEGGLITGFKHYFSLVGFNAWPDMVDFFFGHDPKRDPAEYDRLEAMTLEILDEWANRDHMFTAAQIETLLTENVWGNHLHNELMARIQEVAGSEIRTGLDMRYDETNEDAERDDINKRLATIILAQLAVPGIKVGHVMSTPGLLTLRDDALNTQVRGLPDLMCDAMMDMRFAPLKFEMIARGNSLFPTDSNGVPLYWFDSDFTFFMRSTDEHGKEVLLDSQLQMVLDIPADQNPVTNVQSNVTNTKQDISAHYATAIWGGTGGQQMSGRDLTVTNERPDIINFENGATLFDVLTRVEEDDRSFPSEAPVTPLENNHYRMAAHKVGVYTQPLYLQPIADRPKILDEVSIAQRDFLLEMGFKTSAVEDMRIEVDYLVRQFYGRQGPDAPDQEHAEEIDAVFYLEAVKIMTNNVKNHRNPLQGGLVYWPHHTFWKLAYLANQDRPVEDRWAPVIKEGRGKTKLASSWYEWEMALKAQIEDSKYPFEATWRLVNDGFWHTHQGAIPEFNTIALTDDEQVKLKMWDPETNERYVSNDPILRQALESPQIEEFATLSYDMAIAEKLVLGSVEASLDIPFGGLAEQLEYHKEWQKNNNIKRQKKQTVRDFLKEGHMTQESTRTSTLFMRAMVNLSMQRLLMPALWVEALMSVTFRQGLEQLADLITGRYVGTGAAELEKFTRNAKYSPQEIKLIREAAKMMGSDTEWLAGIIKETTYRSLAMPGGSSFAGAGLERFASWAARIFADPRWGMRGRAVALRYLGGALDYYADTGAMITPAQLVDNLRKDILWVEHSSPEKGVSAHSIGSNRIGQVRSTRNSVLNKIVSGGIESLCASDRALFAGTGLLLKLPFLFNRFLVNQFMTITGLNVIDQAVAVHLTAKKKGGLWHRSIGRRLGMDEPNLGDYDMSDVIESIDLTRAFARTGVTQAGFMALGFIANGYGLGGEDEEMRRRRRMAMYLDVPLQYDPRRSENDFVNADALWLDSVPWLSTHFMDPETGRSSIIPHWTIRQFTSPILGIQRFFETGDVREIGYGFLDAASALPYTVTGLWKEADLTARQLADAAKMEDVQTSAEAQQQSMSLIVKIASVYEKMLVESTFVNTLRNGWDQFDRNPWFEPRTNETGQIVMAEGYDNKPLRSDALIEDARPKLDENGDPVLDEDGQPVMETVTAYRQREGRDAQFHQYAENNMTFAVLASLFSGQLGGESSYWRKNMVNVEREVPLPQSTEADLEALVMSAYIGEGGQPSYTFEELVKIRKKQYEDANIYWDQTQVEKDARAILDAHSEMGALSIISPEGKELITDEGMEAVFRSLQKGGVTFKDASLQGIHADKAMRDRIAERWTTALIQEGIDMGMSEEAAMYRMRRFWYGDSTNPQYQGLRELLYSNDIPRSDTQKYDQLNVTYAIGPDGKPWATPFTRASVWSAIFPVSQRAPEVGPGMGRDKTRGKDVDYTLGINTGMSGLIRQQEEPLEPDDKPMEKSMAKTYTPTTRGVSRTPFRRYSGGGGGGGGSGPYFSRMYALPRGQSPQTDGIRQINTNTPYTRRATVHEERITSDRGRLKQWQ